MTAKCREFPIERLHKLLRYVKRTGKLYWRKRNSEDFTRAKDAKTFNNSHAGKEAGGLDECGHRYICIEHVRIPAHRIVWAMHTGKWPGPVLDHANQMPDDNRFSNLRDVTQHQNTKNCKLSKNNTSGINGVDSYRGKWRARIKINRVYHSLGVFETIEAAAKARADADRANSFSQLHGGKRV